MNRATRTTKQVVEKAYRVSAKYHDVVSEVRRLAKRDKRNSGTPFDKWLTDLIVEATASESIHQVLEKVTAPHATSYTRNRRAGV